MTNYLICPFFPRGKIQTSLIGSCENVLKVALNYSAQVSIPRSCQVVAFLNTRAASCWTWLEGILGVGRVSHSVIGDPIDCSLPGSSVHGISQAGILEWVAILFSRGSSWSRNQTYVSCIAGRFFTLWATREAPGRYIIEFKFELFSSGRYIGGEELKFEFDYVFLRKWNEK